MTKQHSINKASCRESSISPVSVVSPRAATGTQRTSKLLGVQYLRGVAAVMVVWLHASAWIAAFQPRLIWRGIFDVERLQYGVHIFFVISGFIMMVTTTRISSSDFLIRRLIRIVPLYWLLSLALVATALSPLHLFKQSTISLITVSKTLFFIPYADGPLLMLGWTLDVEMFFYLIFTLTLLVSRENRLWIITVLFIAMVTLGGPLMTGKPVPFHDYSIYVRPWMLEFVIGMWLGYGWLRHKLILPRLACIVLAVGGFLILLMPLGQLHNAPGYIIPSAALVAGVVALEQGHGILGLKLLGVLGDASYSLYLSHFFTLSLVKFVWLRFALQLPYVFLAVGVVTSLVVGIALYQWVERPMLERMLRGAARQSVKRLPAAATE